MSDDDPKRDVLSALGTGKEFTSLKFDPAEFQSIATEQSYAILLDAARRLGTTTLQRAERLIALDKEYGQPFLEKVLDREAALTEARRVECIPERDEKIAAYRKKYYLQEAQIRFSNPDRHKITEHVLKDLQKHDVTVPLQALKDSGHARQLMLREIIELCWGKIPGLETLRKIPGWPPAK